MGSENNFTDDESVTDNKTVRKPQIPNDSGHKPKPEGKWTPPNHIPWTKKEKPQICENLKDCFINYFKNDQNFWNEYKLILGLLVLAISMVVLYWFCFRSDERHTTLEDLKNTFPNQDEEFWTTIKSNIELTTKHNEPTTLIYLYTEETQDTVRQILKAVTKYTQHILKVQDYNAIDVDSSQLNTIGRSDYGQILDRYRPQLEKKRIMTVHNFDQLDGSVAQAFHWFCDQYTPVIPKAVFQFTIKVDQIVPKHRLIALVDQILADKWAKKLNQDLLYPLIARVTGTVLSVEKETS